MKDLKIKNGLNNSFNSTPPPPPPPPYAVNEALTPLFCILAFLFIIIGSCNSKDVAEPDASINNPSEIPEKPSILSLKLLIKSKEGNKEIQVKFNENNNALIKLTEFNVIPVEFEITEIKLSEKATSNYKIGAVVQIVEDKPLTIILISDDGNTTEKYTVNFLTSTASIGITSLVIYAKGNKDVNTDIVGLIEGENVYVYIPKDLDWSNLQATIRHNGSEIQKHSQNGNEIKYSVTEGDVNKIITVHIIYDSEITNVESFLTSSMEDIEVSSRGLISKNGEQWFFMVPAKDRFPISRLGNGPPVKNDMVSISTSKLTELIENAYKKVSVREFKGMYLSAAKSDLVNIMKSMKINIEAFQQNGINYAKFNFDIELKSTKGTLITLKGNY